MFSYRICIKHFFLWIFFIIIIYLSLIVIGVGEIADVQLSYLEGGLEEPQLGETEDINAKQISRFENCYPSVVYTREIKIQNKA